MFLYEDLFFKILHVNLNNSLFDIPADFIEFIVLAAVKSLKVLKATADEPARPSSLSPQSCLTCHTINRASHGCSLSPFKTVKTLQRAGGGPDRTTQSVICVTSRG